MSIAVLRRRLLGHGGMFGKADGSSIGIVNHLHDLGVDVNVVRNDGKNYKNYIRNSKKGSSVTLANADYVVRWGCTSTIPNRSVINTARAIHQVNDKLGFREVLNRFPDLALNAITKDSSQDEIEEANYPLVVRKNTHSQGKDLWVVNTSNELRECPAYSNPDGWYATKLINKKAEYRVAVVAGRVIWVVEKTPDDPDAVAWNVHQGGRFDNVRFGQWPLQVVRKAIEAFNLTDLDFGGVDVMVDHDNRAYIIEINSAPSMTSNYRQECFAKAFKYIDDNGKSRIPLINERGGWKKFIHPAISSEALL